MRSLPGSKGDSFFKNSFFIFIIRFFPSLANLVILLYYSRFLDRSTYGLYQNFWIQLNMVYPFACMGIHVFIVAYTPAHIVAMIRKVSARAYIPYALWLITLSLGFVMLQPRAIHLGFWTPFFFVITYAGGIILESYLIVLKNFKSLTVINIAYAVAYCLVHILLLSDHFSFRLLFGCLLLLNIVRLSVFCCISFVSTRSLPPPAGRISVSSARNQWFHLGVYDVIQVTFTWVDKFVISLVLTAALSGIYFNGTQNIPFLPLLFSAAGSAVLMQLAATQKANENEESILLINQSSCFLASIVFPVFLFLVFFRYQLFALLLPAYTASVPIFLASVLVLPLRAYSFTTLLQKKHKASVINTGAVLDIVMACLLMYPMYRWLGLAGVALSFVISTYFQAGFYLVATGKVMGVSVARLLPFKNWLVKAIIFSVVYIMVSNWLPVHFTALISLVLGGVLTVAIVSVSLLIEYKRNK